MFRCVVVIICLLSASPAFAQSNLWTLRVAIASSMIADGADLATTTYLMGQSAEAERLGYPARYREGNPLLSGFERNPAGMVVVKLGLASGVNLWLVKLHENHPKLALTIAIANTSLKTWIALRNQNLK